MANFFDQFDPAPQNSASGQRDNANFFDQFDGPAEPPPATGVVEDVAKTVPSALARGAAGVAGIPGLVSSGADWLFSKVTGTSPEEMTAARERAKTGQRETFGFNLPRADEVLMPERITGAIENVTGPLYKPQTNTGRYVGAVAEMAPGMVMGGGSAWEKALSTIGAGIGSEGGGDLFKGTWFEPYAKIVGGIVGGVTGAVTPTVAERGFAGIKEGAKSATAPMREQGRRDLAARELLNRAENPTAFRAALEDPATMYPGAKPGELVPGAAPTTFQRTGDMGIGALEREVATQNPVDFMTRRAEQNAARVAALDAVQPTGSAADVSALLRQQLQAVDDQTQRIVDRITAQARTATDAAVPAIGADDVGTRMREALAAARAQAKAQERALWRAVDPDGTMTINVAPLRNTAREIETGLGPMARALEGEERDIIAALRGAPETMPFQDLRDLRSRISGAMSEEMRARGQTPAYARLTQLRGALETTIDTAVQRRVAQEADAVAAGAMRAEDTLAERLRAETQQWRDARTAATGTNAGAGDLGPATGRAPAVPGNAGAEVAAAGRSGNAPGGPGLPVATPLDDAAAERLRAASAATRERAQTYDRGPAGEALKTTGFAGDYKALPGAVPAKFFTAGPTGADRVGAYMAAVRDPAQAAADLGAAAAASLRQAAIRPDGTLDPRKFDTWLRQHRPALDAVPGVRDQFATAARASQAIEVAAAARRQALEAAQAGAVGRLIGVTDPQDVVKTVGAIFGRQNGVQEMRDLAARARATPEGIAGLRRAVAEHINTKLMTNAEAAASGTNLISANAFQNFVKQNRDTLRQVFTPQEVEMMGRIAEDITRANRSVTAIKLPGGSNTPQDLAAKAARERPNSLLAQLLRLKDAAGPVGGAAAGFFTLGAPGIPLGAAAGWVNAARQAGLEKVDDLVKQALLDPALARTLLKEAPVKMDRGPWLELSRQLGRLGVFGVEGAASERQERASGGAVAGPFGGNDDAEDKMAAFVASLPPEARKPSLGEALATTWPVKMAKSAYEAATLPGDVYAGRVDPMSDEAIGRSFDLAGLVTLGSGAVPASKGAGQELRAGVKLRGGAETPETDLAWYFKDVKPKPSLTPAENRRFSAGATTYDSAVVPVRALNATQPKVNADFATTTSSSGELPYVFRKNGELYVSDGHHRINKVIHEGGENVRVRLLDFDGKDTSAPLLDWKPPKKSNFDISDDDLLRELGIDIPKRKAGGRVNPTDAQKEAGNYKMTHTVFQGLPISIETKRNQTRSGVDASGKPWSVRMPADYGYIKRTEGADGDHVDVYLGPIKDAKLAFVVDQRDLKTGAFDEHKIFLGFRNRGHAEQTYRAGFSDGKGGKRLGAITPMSIDALKAWLAGSGAAKPVAYAGK